MHDIEYKVFCRVCSWQSPSSSLHSCLYCTRWCSVCVLSSWWQFLSTATPSTPWLALPLPCQGCPSTSWVSIYQSPNDRLSSPSYCVSLPHIQHPKATGTLCPTPYPTPNPNPTPNNVGSTGWHVVISYCRFSDSLHPVQLLLCTDRNGQKWIASNTLQDFTQQSLHPHSWQSPEDQTRKKDFWLFHCTVHHVEALRPHWLVYSTETAAMWCTCADISWNSRTLKDFNRKDTQGPDNDAIHFILWIDLKDIVCSMCECAESHLRIKVNCRVHFLNGKKGKKIIFVCCYVKILSPHPDGSAFLYFWCRCLIIFFFVF